MFLFRIFTKTFTITFEPFSPTDSELDVDHMDSAVSAPSPSCRPAVDIIIP